MNARASKSRRRPGLATPAVETSWSAVPAPSPTRLARDLSGIRLQAKMAVGSPKTGLEQEADRVADGIGSAPAAKGSCGCGGSCGECGIQRSAHPGAIPEMAAPPSVHHALSSAGQPLDAGTRGFMESRLGHDFSSVRVHADPQAGRSARDIGALAFTAGRDIVFAPGQFKPHTADGRRLLAHELTHVVQQSPAIQRKADDRIPCAVHAHDNSAPADKAIVPADGSGVGVSSVADLVSKVNAYVDNPANKCSCVNKLVINGHGADGYQSVGNGHLYINNEKALVHDSTDEHLQQMSSIKFCGRGLLMLVGCHVGRGNGKVLLQRLSAILPGKLIGGAQHFTAPMAAGGARVAGEDDLLSKTGGVPRDKSDPFLTSRFVRWHLTIDGKEYVINGDETDTPEGKSKLKKAERIKVKTPEGTKIIK